MTPEILIRVINEKHEVAAKLVKLDRFIESEKYEELSMFEQDLLEVQADILADLYNVLCMRIGNAV